MTTEAFEEVDPYDISGQGPYPIGHAYTVGAIAAVVEQSDGTLVQLVADTDFSLVPLSGDSGDLTLSAAAATAYDGDQLKIRRRTTVEQGFAGQNAREVGLEANIDRLAMALQEVVSQAYRGLRVETGEAEPYTPEDGRMPIYNAARGGFENGPTANDIPLAQGYAEAAQAWAANPQGVEVEAGLFSALHYALAAALFDPALYLTKADNLSGLATPAVARANLGVAIGSDVQAQNAVLESLAGIAVDEGDLLVGTGPNALTAFPKGLVGQVLRWNGTTLESVYPAGELISSVDLANDPQSDHTLSSDYRLHIFDLNYVTPATDGSSLGIRLSSDGSSFDNGASDYAWEGFRQSGGSAVAATDNADSRIALDINRQIGGAANEYGVSGRLYVFNPSQAKHTEVSGQFRITDNTGAIRSVIMSGSRLSTTAMNALRLFYSTGNLASGNIIHTAIRGA